MFKFVRGNKIQEGKKTKATAASTILNQQDDSQPTIQTKLSIRKGTDITDEERYVYAYHNSQSPKLKKNQISIYGMELLRNTPGQITITGLIRSTATKPIKFEEATIVLNDDETGETIARKTFDLQAFGTLPRNSARPWEFVFTEGDFIRTFDDSLSNWSLAFELEETGHRLDLDESWQQSIKPETVNALEKIVKEAPTLKEGELNFLGVQARFDDEGQLAVTVLLRNGSDRNMKIEQIPLGVRDASKEEIARGSFKLDNFEVKANTSKPWTFIFPKSMIKKENPDFSSWAAYAIQD